MKVHRDAAAVVRHGDAVVQMNQHFDLGTVTRDGLVDTVVHQFKNQMVQAIAAGAANIHGGPFSHRIKTFENLDVGGVVNLFLGLVHYGFLKIKI